MGTEQLGLYNQRQLPCGTVLHEEYEVKRVLGEGGFGITYEGVICGRNERVAIKEYFPQELAVREYAGSTLNLHIFSGEKARQYDNEKNRFLREAEALRKFQYLEGIVSVIDYFEENNTAYIVMEYIEGITLKQYVAENGVLSFAEIIELLTPVMKSLIQIHRQGLIHRDISPDNLLIGLDNKARLIDFGASRWLDEQDGRTQTIILKKCYAPPEQYIQTGKQGAWTDVYGLAATMYLALVGHAPQVSVERMHTDEINEECFDGLDMEGWQKKALICAMELNLAKRYKNVEEFYHALVISPSNENSKTTRSIKTSVHDEKRIKRLEKKKNTFYPLLVLFLAIGCIIAIVIMLYNSSNKKNINMSGDKDTGSTEILNNDMADESADAGGQILISMPKVTQISETAAKDMIKNTDPDILIKIVKTNDDTQPQGVVIGQSVAAGTVYNQGAITEITLTVNNVVSNNADADKTDNSFTDGGDTSGDMVTTQPGNTYTKEAVTEVVDESSEDVANDIGNEPSVDEATNDEGVTPENTVTESAGEPPADAEKTTEKTTEKDTSTSKKDITTKKDNTEDFEIIEQDDYESIGLD